MKRHECRTVECNPTKIVCTLGPATANPDILAGMLAAGMDVARLNFSHGTHESHAEMIGLLRQVAGEMAIHVPLIADLQGPKIRTGLLENGIVELIAGADITLKVGSTKRGNAATIYTNYQALCDDVKTGDTVLLDDGLLQLQVTEVGKEQVRAKVMVGGMLGEHKGINLPMTHVSASSLTEKDLADLDFAIEQGIDYLALSFVRSADDVQELRAACRSRDRRIPIIAKLERPEALDHLEEIISVADAVMVARGDLGVELPPEEVPVWQKRIIRLCALRRVPVITATQMLESMRDNPRPTRAEASDVANAIFDGTDAVMLSAETSVGHYPVQAVEMMRRICAFAEQEQFSTRPHHARTKLESSDHSLGIADAVSRAAARTAEEVGARAILAFTASGSTARMASKSRPTMPVIAITPDPATARRCGLYWGVTPVQTEEAGSSDDAIPRCIGIVRDMGMVDVGDTVVITAGTHMGRRGATNMMRIHRVRADM